MGRREYKIDEIIINGISVNKVIIDPHYEKKHSDHIDDQLIVKLVLKLDGRLEAPEEKDGRIAYFVTLLILNSKQYRLVWLLDEDFVYVGVVNAYRDDRKD